jgi:hypothetical protein
MATRESIVIAPASSMSAPNFEATAVESAVAFALSSFDFEAQEDNATMMAPNNTSFFIFFLIFSECYKNKN